MNFDNNSIDLKQNISIRNLLSENGKGDLIREIVKGLTSDSKYISSKFFYDDIGSSLFEDITTLKEYYPTRTEKSIFKSYAAEIIGNIGNKDIIELGSGDCSKISMLIEAIPRNQVSSIRYIPVDVSRSAIINSSESLVTLFPELSIDGYVLDFTTHIEELPRERSALICFFGSTIGNFPLVDAQNLLRRISRIMQEGDTLLVGFDMIKQSNILNSAYNDFNGITAQFNKNILSVVNSIIKSDFSTEDFNHLAFYNKERSSIEMHLEAKRDLVIHSRFLPVDLTIAKGERIHTENSRKFTNRMISDLVNETGLIIEKSYSDRDGWFSLVAMKNQKG